MKTKTRIKAGQSGPGGGYYPGDEEVSYLQQAPVAPAQVIPYGTMEPLPPRAEEEPPWADRTNWQGLQSRGMAPLPTNVNPGSLPNEEMARYARGGSMQAMMGPMQDRVATLRGGASQQDRAYGKPLQVPAPGASAMGAGGGSGTGMPGEMAPFSGQKMMIVGGTPAKYSRADIAREAALSSRMKGQQAGFAEARDQLTRDTIQQSFGWLQAAQNEQVAAGKEVGAAKVEYERASASIKRNRAILAKMEIDPERYWKNLPESQKVLNVIGLMFGGFAEGLSGGRVKNAAMTLIKNAQDRDMAAQSANMRKMITTIDMDERDRNALWSRWESGEAKRRHASLAVMQLQVSRAGLMEKRLGFKEQYAGLVNGLDQHMLDVMRQSRGSGGRKVPTPEYEHWRVEKKMRLGADLQLRNQTTVAEIKATGKAAKGDRGENAISNARAALPQLKAYWEKMPFVKGEHDPTGISQSYERLRTRTSVGLWRLFDSGKLSDFDMITAMKNFFPPAKWANSWEQKASLGLLDYKSAYGQAFDQVGSFLDEMDAKLKAGGGGYNIPAERKAQIKTLWMAKGLATE